MGFCAKATTLQAAEANGSAEEHDRGERQLQLYLTKRPDVWPRWDLDEASEDDEAVPADVLFAMVVNTKVVRMDSLQKCSALLIGKMKPEFQIYNGKPLPKILHSLVNDLTNKDLCK